MLEVKECSRVNRLRGFVKEFKEHSLSTNDKILYYKLNEVKVGGSNCQFTVEQQMKTVKHTRPSKQ